MPEETSITANLIIAIIKDVVKSNHYFAGAMDGSTEAEFWQAVDARVKHIGGGGLPR